MTDKAVIDADKYHFPVLKKFLESRGTLNISFVARSPAAAVDEDNDRCTSFIRHPIDVQAGSFCRDTGNLVVDVSRWLRCFSSSGGQCRG